jgi:hypothetical protein
VSKQEVSRKNGEIAVPCALSLPLDEAERSDGRSGRDDNPGETIVKQFILVAAAMAALATAAQANGGEGPYDNHKAKPPAGYAKKTPPKKTEVKKPYVKKVHAAGYAAKPAPKSYAPPAKPAPTYTPPAKVKAAPAPYYKSHGVRYAEGYYYSGRKHSHWSESKYSSTWGTTVYLDPGLKVWYCWNEKEKGYYPIGAKN